MGPVTILEGPSSSTTESSNTFSVNVWIKTDDVESKEVIASWTPNGEKTLWKLCLLPAQEDDHYIVSFRINQASFFFMRLSFYHYFSEENKD